MVENMKNVASANQELSVEERNLLSVAYKNVIGARRASWRIVTSIEQKEESKGNESQVHLIKEYRQKIEAELAKICEDILEVLEKHLIPSAQSGESKVFYHKMYAQTAVLPVGSATDHLEGRATITATSLSSRSAISVRPLRTSHWRHTRLLPKSRPPIWHLRILSALVSLSTSRSSTMRFSIRQIKLATSPSRPLTMLLLVSFLTFNASLHVLKLCLELDTLSEESYKDSTLIMQLLRDNLASSSLIVTC